MDARAFVEHKFFGRFVLVEDRIRRLAEIIRNRLADGEKLLIQVDRSDSLSYSMDGIEGLCSEDNGPSAHVVGVEYRVRKRAFYVLLEFDTKDGVRLYISGEDRDRVLLLGSELKSYIDQEVMVLRWLRYGQHGLKISSLGVVVITLGLAVLAVVLVGVENIGGNRFEIIKANENISAKINFLIDEAERDSSVLQLLTFLLSAILMSLTLLAMPVLQILRPSNDFFIGKRVERLNRARSLRSNLFWGVFVGALVSVVVAIVMR